MGKFTLTLIFILWACATVAAADEIDDYLTVDAFHQAGARFEFTTAAEQFLHDYPDSDKAPEVLFSLAQSQTNPFAAIRRFRKLLDDYPQSQFSARGLFQIGQLYFLLNDYKQAASTFGLFYAEYPDHELAAQSLIWQCRSQIGAEQSQAARQTLDTFAAAFSGAEYKGQTGVLRASVLFTEGSYDQAIEACDRQLADSPLPEFVPRLLLIKADSLMRAGKHDRAWEIYARIKRDFPFSAEAANASEIR